MGAAAAAAVVTGSGLLQPPVLARSEKTQTLVWGGWEGGVLTAGREVGVGVGGSTGGWLGLGGGGEGACGVDRWRALPTSDPWLWLLAGQLQHANVFTSRHDGGGAIRRKEGREEGREERKETLGCNLIC